MAGGLAADPQLEQHRVGAVTGVQARRGGSVAGWPMPREDAPPEPADQLEALGGRVEEHQLVDREHVAQPAEPVDQLRGVRRASADDRDLSFIP